MLLLGKPAIGKLGLIRFIQGVNQGDGHDWKTAYPNLFCGLGVMSTEVRNQKERMLALLLKQYLGALQQLGKGHCKMSSVRLKSN